MLPGQAAWLAPRVTFCKLRQSNIYRDTRIFRIRSTARKMFVSQADFGCPNHQLPIWQKQERT
jgi:hypothetical protein